MREPAQGKSDAGRRREERARATRRRIVDAARRLFEADGYVATTVSAIAEAASVAPATVYQAFGTKQQILIQALDTAIVSDMRPVGVLDRDWVRRARKRPDPRRRLAEVIAHTSAIAARTAPLKQAMRDAAATDPAMHRLIDEDHRRRLTTQRTLVDMAVGDASLRAGVDRERAAATFFALVNSDGYLLATQVLGWDLDRWRSWLTEVLTHELFGGPADTMAGS